MQVWALISQKGGSGKSSLAIHLAAEAAKAGRRVLLVDLDPQGNAISWGRRRTLPPDVSAESPAALRDVLSAAKTEGYDLAVLDTAPHANTVALQAAKSADRILIPCRPSQFDLEAIAATLELCELARKPAAVVINAAPIRSRVVAEADEAIRGHGGMVCPVVIHERVAFRHCIPAGQTAGEFEPGCAAAEEISALFAYLSGKRHSDTLTKKEVA